MSTGHLSEQQIQHYALDKNRCTQQERQHVQECSHCKSKTETYQFIFTTIKGQPQPAFDFDLADCVLEKLPQPNSSIARRPLFFMLGLAFFSMGVVVYLLWSPLLNLFSGTTPLSMYLIIMSGMSVLAFLCLERYLTFLKKMKDLNYS